MNNLFFISGGPCTGKTSVINELKERGYNTIPEAARLVAENDSRFKGKTIKEIDLKAFQNEIFSLQKRQTGSLIGKGGIYFSDRGFGDSLAYTRMANLDFPDYFFDYARKFRNSPVFILEPLEFYRTDELRTESPEEREVIHAEIIRAYEELGHPIIRVPVMEKNERADFVLQKSLKGS
ncbi:MAG: ATP-binding protein [Nanoarchaeota archaeon]